jgi:hypothetical protein
MELYFATFPLSCFLSSINVITTKKKFLIVAANAGGGVEREGDKKCLTKCWGKVFLMCSKGRKGWRVLGIAQS